MDRSEAAIVLGVEPTSDPVAVREAYRVRIRARHPDRAGPQATADAARLNEAYALLRQPVPAAPTATAATGAGTSSRPPSATTRPQVQVQVLDDDTLTIAIPADEVFLLLLDAAHDVGEVTYVDPDGGLIEAIVAFADPGVPVCSVVLSLQGRADRVEAFCTVESLDGTRPPPIADVVALLAARVRRRLDG